MNVLIFLIPLTLIMSLAGLLAFLWCTKNKQYDDLEGSSRRILFDDYDIRIISGTYQNKTGACYANNPKSYYDINLKSGK